MLRLAFVTGTEPGKWFARYRDTTDHGLEETPSDDPFALLIDGSADLALLRLPDPRVGAPGERFHQVQLYAEKPGVAVPKDSVYAEVGEAVRLSDLADEHVNYRFVPDSAGDAARRGDGRGGDALGAVKSSSSPELVSVDGPGGNAGTLPLSGGSIDELRAALQVVAANVGIAFAPAPLLKVLSKKQVVVLELLDGREEEPGTREAGADDGAEGAETHIALVWEVEKDSDAIQDFVGVAKGRTRNSSRGAETQKSGRERAAVNRKVKSKNSGQRKGARSNYPEKGVRKNRR